MQELNWNITQFKHIFSYPSDAETGAEAYAQDMVNLRVDRWGRLRQRPAIKPLTMANANGIAPDDISITGVAAGARELAYARSDGKLFLADAWPTTPVAIDDVTDMNGRLCLVEVGDSKIVTSSGSDQGHVIANDAIAQRGSNAAEPLGQLPKPSTLTFSAGLTETNTGYVLFKLTFSGNGRLGELESVPSAVQSVRTDYTTYNSGMTNTMTVSVTAPNDSRIERVNLYQSATIEDSADDRESAVYYRVFSGKATPGGTTAFTYDLTNATEIDISHPLLDNSPMPSDVGQFAVFNDRLFGAASAELRFSEVRYGTPLWGVWPVLNAIRIDTAVEFCAAYRGMLLFGGADSLYRLTGTSPANYDYDQISARGPVSPYAWGILNNAFAFVGADGLYFTDGTSAPETAPQLKGFFNRYDVKSGVVGMLPNKASLWGVWGQNRTTGAADIVYFVNEDGGWTRLREGADSTQIRQYASVRFAGEPLHGVIADQRRAPRLLDWSVDDSAVDGMTAYSGQDDAPTEQIEWEWESQELNWSSQGAGEEMKTFKELIISGTAQNNITVAVTIDDRSPTTKTVSLNRSGNARFDPVRVRIDRRGFACRFKISGSGPVNVRGMKLTAWI